MDQLYQFIKRNGTKYFASFVLGSTTLRAEALLDIVKTTTSKSTSLKGKLFVAKHVRYNASTRIGRALPKRH